MSLTHSMPDFLFIFSFKGMRFCFNYLYYIAAPLYVISIYYYSLAAMEDIFPLFYYLSTTRFFPLLKGFLLGVWGKIISPTPYPFTFFLQYFILLPQFEFGRMWRLWRLKFATPSWGLEKLLRQLNT